MPIDDLSNPAPLAANGADWQLFTDQVMGGVSRVTMVRETVASRAAIRMRGDVSLENNGGFMQMRVDLHPNGSPFDASGFEGIEIDVCGNGEMYGLHLRTEDVTRPCQSHRQELWAHRIWQTVQLPFSAFEPHRIDKPLDLRRLRRIGLAAIGRAFPGDLVISRIASYGAA